MTLNATIKLSEYIKPNEKVAISINDRSDANK